jgi:hypothetical protein
LTFWLVNLVIAVITSSFQVTREELQQSAFVSRRQQYSLYRYILIIRKLLDNEIEGIVEERPISYGQRLYDRTKLIWIGLIAIDLTIQALRTATMSTSYQRLLGTSFRSLVNIDITETVATVIFDVEIIIRFAVSFPDWRSFFRKKSNCLDLFLALATSVIQIQPIHNSGVYGWLTIFQIMRVYRIIMAVPITRDLLVSSRYDCE